MPPHVALAHTHTATPRSVAATAPPCRCRRHTTLPSPLPHHPAADHTRTCRPPRLPPWAGISGSVLLRTGFTPASLALSSSGLAPPRHLKLLPRSSLALSSSGPALSAVCRSQRSCPCPPRHLKSCPCPPRRLKVLPLSAAALEGPACPYPPRRTAPAPIDVCPIEAPGEDSALLLLMAEGCCSILICSIYYVAAAKMLT
jgi:hypothetical protein